jgi:hypothetical protein
MLRRWSKVRFRVGSGRFVPETTDVRFRVQRRHSKAGSYQPTYGSKRPEADVHL